MTLSVERLQAIKTIVTHADCPDGIASAMVLKNVLPSAKVIFLRHNQPEHVSLPVEPGMLFCDFPPHGGSADEHRKAGTIILDHHIGAKALVESFGENGIFADEVNDPGVSGARLAFLHVWIPLTCNKVDSPQWVLVDHFSKVVGVRDTWQVNDPLWRESRAQAEVLRFYPVSSWLQEGERYPDIFYEGNPKKWADLMKVGKLLVERAEEQDRKTLNTAFRFTIDDLNIVIFQGLHTSDIAETLGREADLVMGWSYVVESPQDVENWSLVSDQASPGPKMIVSCRSRSKFSAVNFAKSFGGGGHSAAAGFSVHVKPTDFNPYFHLKQLVRSYLAT